MLPRALDDRTFGSFNSLILLDSVEVRVDCWRESVTQVDTLHAALCPLLRAVWPPVMRVFPAHGHSRSRFLFVLFFVISSLVHVMCRVVTFLQKLGRQFLIGPLQPAPQDQGQHLPGVEELVSHPCLCN